MDKLQILKDILTQSRNGANKLIRHPLFRRMRYSDGVQEIADQLGTYWLLDIIATECAGKFIAAYDAQQVGVAMIEVKVEKSVAHLSMTFVDGHPAVWHRKVNYTDLPDHTWTLALGADSEGGATTCNLILITEY